MAENNSNLSFELLTRVYGNQPSAKDVLAQITPLLEWIRPDWGARLEALEILWKLKQEHSGFDWIGIYRREPGQSELILSTYIGPPTAHTRIPIDKGICGAAIRENATLNVPDVHKDNRFIACCVRTRSELVIPIRNNDGEAVAEIDIDSNQLNYFSKEIEQRVEAAAQRLAEIPDLFEFN